MKKPFLFFIFLSLYLCVGAQEKVEIKGKVLADCFPLGFSSVVVYNDTTGFKIGGSSDTSGLFIIKLPKGNYDFEVSFVGYQKYISKINIEKDTFLG